MSRVPEDRWEHISISIWLCRRSVLAHEYAERRQTLCIKINQSLASADVICEQRGSCLELTAQMRPMLISETLLPKPKVSLTPAPYCSRQFSRRVMSGNDSPEEVESREIQRGVIEAVFL